MGDDAVWLIVIVVALAGFGLSWSRGHPRRGRWLLLVLCALPAVVLAQAPVTAWQSPMLKVPVWVLYAGSIICMLVAIVMLSRHQHHGRCRCQPHRKLRL